MGNSCRVSLEGPWSSGPLHHLLLLLADVAMTHPEDEVACVNSDCAATSFAGSAEQSRRTASSHDGASAAAA